MRPNQTINATVIIWHNSRFKLQHAAYEALQQLTQRISATVTQVLSKS